MRTGVISIAVVGLIFLLAGACSADGTAVGKTGDVSEPINVWGGTPKSPGFAATLSLLVPGFGQVYNNDGGKALIMCGIETLSWLVYGFTEAEGVGFFGLVFGRIVSPVDAYYSAVEKNKGLSLQIDNDKVLLAVKARF